MKYTTDQYAVQFNLFYSILLHLIANTLQGSCAEIPVRRVVDHRYENVNFN